MRADPRELAAVFAGGCAGAVARVLLGEALPHTPGTWPWATFLANVLGAFLLGWVAARAPRPRRALLGAGFCGAFTTFSALQLELLELLDADRIGLAVLYAGASVAAGLLAVRLAPGPA